jgi:hypothetical protein
VSKLAIDIPIASYSTSPHAPPISRSQSLGALQLPNRATSTPLVSPLNRVQFDAQHPTSELGPRRGVRTA